MSNSLGTLERRTLAEQAASAISGHIDSGDFPPGARLVETQLAEQMRISRGPLREALQALERQGLVERRGAQGTFVRNPSPEAIAHATIIRGMMEGLGARYAALAAESILPSLEAYYEEMRRAAGARDRSGFFAAHRAFHKQVVETAGSEMLDELIETIRAQIGLHIRRSGSEDPGYERMLRNHVLFIEAIGSGDPDRAERVLRTKIIRSGFARLGRPIPAAIESIIDPE